MKAETSVWTIPKFRSFTSADKKGNVQTFYLSKGVILEDGEPKVYVSRWSAEDILRAIEKQYSMERFSLHPQTLYESFRAADLDKKVRDSIFREPAEQQKHLILKSNAPAETNDYVIKDAQRNNKTLGPSKKARNILPVKTYKYGEKNIVEANIFDIPFQLKNGKFNPEDLDPDSGFLTKLDPNGKYTIWFGESEILYATVLYWSGSVDCCWVPGLSLDHVGLRGRSSGNLPEELLETEEDVLRARIEKMERGHGKKDPGF